MIVKRFFSGFIFTETFVFFIIVLNVFFAFPVLMTFYSEVIIGVHGKSAVAVIGFKQPLRKRDAGGNSVLEHFFDGNVLVLFNILNPRHLVFRWLSKQNGKWKMNNE